MSGVGVDVVAPGAAAAEDDERVAAEGTAKVGATAEGGQEPPLVPELDEAELDEAPWLTVPPGGEYGAAMAWAGARREAWLIVEGSCGWCAV